MVAEPAESKKNTARVNLSPAADRMLREIKAKTGLPKERLVERLVEWYTAQHDDVKMHLRSPEGDPGAALMKLKLKPGDGRALTSDRALDLFMAAVQRVADVEARLQKLVEELEKKKR